MNTVNKYVTEPDLQWHKLWDEMPSTTTHVEFRHKNNTIVQGQIVVDMAGYYCSVGCNWSSFDYFTEWRYQKREFGYEVKWDENRKHLKHRIVRYFDLNKALDKYSVVRDSKIRMNPTRYSNLKFFVRTKDVTFDVNRYLLLKSSRIEIQDKIKIVQQKLMSCDNQIKELLDLFHNI